MSVLELVRPDLRAFAGYASARRGVAQGNVWLNANESPWASPADGSGLALNRYPEPQPAALRDALAALYGVGSDGVLVGRGSDEGIDLLVRALCRPRQDAVVVSTPVFGMYAVSARLQDAPLVDVPLIEGGDGFATDFDAVSSAAIANDARVVFVCSPGNPTAQAESLDAIAALAASLAGRAVVVVDEAYGEYSDVASAATLMASHSNLAVLRTLSKAHALAAARIGTLLAAPELIAVLRNCQAPYPLPAPCVALALAALAPAALARTRERVAATRRERERLRAGLARCPGVRRVYVSAGNFLLARFDDADAAFDALLAHGVVVRDMRAAPRLHDALRITVGSAAENDAVLAALARATRAAS